MVKLVAQQVMIVFMRMTTILVVNLKIYVLLFNMDNVGVSILMDNLGLKICNVAQMASHASMILFIIPNALKLLQIQLIVQLPMVNVVVKIGMVQLVVFQVINVQKIQNIIVDVLLFLYVEMLSMVNVVVLILMATHGLIAILHAALMDFHALTSQLITVNVVPMMVDVIKL